MMHFIQTGTMVLQVLFILVILTISSSSGSSTNSYRTRTLKDNDWKKAGKNGILPEPGECIIYNCRYCVGFQVKNGYHNKYCFPCGGEHCNPPKSAKVTISRTGKRKSFVGFLKQKQPNKSTTSTTTTTTTSINRSSTKTSFKPVSKKVANFASKYINTRQSLDDRRGKSKSQKHVMINYLVYIISAIAGCVVLALFIKNRKSVTPAKCNENEVNKKVKQEENIVYNYPIAII